MSEVVAHPKRYTQADYLAFEETADVRHELVDGVIYAMVGGSDDHNLIAFNLAMAFANHLPDSCQVFEQSMKLRIRSDVVNDFYYPDIMVSCDETDRERLFRERPVIVGEVLSPSSEREDRREKFQTYKAIDSVREIVIILQDVPQIELYRRDKAWQVEACYLNDDITFPSVGLTVPVRQLYRRTRFHDAAGPARSTNNNSQDQ